MTQIQKKKRVREKNRIIINKKLPNRIWMVFIRIRMSKNSISDTWSLIWRVTIGRLTGELPIITTMTVKYNINSISKKEIEILICKSSSLSLAFGFFEMMSRQKNVKKMKKKKKMIKNFKLTHAMAVCDVSARAFHVIKLESSSSFCNKYRQPRLLRYWYILY